MKKQAFHFVATGEVLGQRLMSQNLQALRLIEKKSGLDGYLLRPLSAKLLKQSIPEQLGWVDRSKLLDIYGRSRKRQLELAKKYNLKEYSTPAGGCILTDPGFSKRLRELFNRWPDCRPEDVELLKIGRHFWRDDIKIVVGRDKEENERLEKLVKKPRRAGLGGRHNVLVKPRFPGPTVLIRAKKKEITPAVIDEAKELIERYSHKAGIKHSGFDIFCI